MMNVTFAELAPPPRALSARVATQESARFLSLLESVVSKSSVYLLTAGQFVLCPPAPSRISTSPSSRTLC
eukprot:5987726-Pleurochrysis_carterae.AAC.1